MVGGNDWRRDAEAAQLTHQKAKEVDHGQQPDGADVQHNQRHWAVVRRLVAPTGHSGTPVDEPGQPVADLNHLRTTETPVRRGREPTLQSDFGMRTWQMALFFLHDASDVLGLPRPFSKNLAL